MNKFGKKWAQDQKVSNGGEGMSLGEGRSKIESNLEGTTTFGEGEKGSYGASKFSGKTTAFADEFNVQRNADGESVAQRGIWKKNDQSNNQSKGEAVGQGSVASGSNNQASMIQAQGEKASKGMTRSSGMSDFYSDDFQIQNTANGIDKVRKISQNQEKSEG